MADIDIAWLKATLEDAQEELENALARLNTESLATAEEVLNRDIVRVYAKLNYAVNTARLGQRALETMTDDELIAWPEGMPFAYPDGDEADDFEDCSVCESDKE